MLAGTGPGVLMFDSVSIWAIMLMAPISSPIDTALGRAVVKSEDVRNRIRVVPACGFSCHWLHR